MALAIVLSIIALRVWVVETAIVEGHSMATSLAPNDRVLVLKPAPILRFDIVVFEDPQSRTIAIKRVVGLPGDTVSMVPRLVGDPGRIQIPIGSDLYINGEVADEPWADGVFPSSVPPTKIPDDAYFLLGDNRDDSIDSRRYGPVPRSAIRGVGAAVVYPPAKMRLIKRTSQSAAPVAAEKSF